MDPQNYDIQYSNIGTLYVNPTGNNLRKIRTYLDCVEENFSDPDGLFYIAHYRYENPNEETIYIAEGPDNQLTGPAQYMGELPFIFLPGQGTFSIRFDGNTLKWELTSRNSTHKSSTTSNANANSNRCNSGFEGTDPPFILYPNPVNGLLYIDQDISEVVTLDIFDFYGILYLNTSLDGRNGPITHEINMAGYPEGMYFIRITTKDDVNVFTVVKD
ncbi:MAG: T9SS type A sorting domain-containing protein [Eudoraea sp.]|nr:T9SS type A sorting domain-containing protein [Eudoraea sp.]